MMEGAERLRVFVAIDLPPRVKAAIGSVSQQLAGIKGRIGWVKPQGVHLTLKFLGNVSPRQLERVKQALEASVGNIQPFSLQLTELGVFPNKNRPRVIWWGLTTNSPQLLQLYRSLENPLVKCGFPREKRRFTPHLTLGRVRELAQPQQLTEQMAKVKTPTLAPIAVSQLELMQSTLTGTGAVYKRLASFPFGKT